MPCPNKRPLPWLKFAASLGALARLGNRALKHDNLYFLLTAGRAGESSFVDDGICPLPY